MHIGGVLLNQAECENKLKKNKLHHRLEHNLLCFKN